MSYSAKQSKSDDVPTQPSPLEQAVQMINEVNTSLTYFSPHITFGLEYEFIYAFQIRVLERFLNRRIERVSSDIKDYLTNRLQQKGGSQSKDPDSKTKLPNAGLHSRSLTMHHHHGWFLTSDPSIGCMQEEVAEAFGVTKEEVDGKWEFVEDVLYDNTSAFSQTHSEGAMWNDTTGLHVHMAYAEMNDPSHLPVLKYVAIIWGVCEDAIAKVHPPHRHHSKLGYAQSVRVNCKPYSHELFAWGVFNAKSLEHLQSMIAAPGSDPGYSQVKFSNARKGKPLTIEFRQHRGTVSMNEVSNWVHFCAGVIHLACKLVATEFNIINPATLHELADTIFLRVGLRQEQINFFMRKAAEYGDPEWQISLRNLVG